MREMQTMIPEKHYAVAVDGPSGAGKSTLAKAIAAKLGILYVDTGAIYRTIGYAVELEMGMSCEADGEQHMLLNGQDVTREIRLPEISMYASAVSALPAVRAFLLEMQRDLARKHSVIMDGRDIGTVVLPDAEVKIFLTASAEVRAQRRCLELEQRGTPKPYDEVLRELNERDYNDSHRAAAPLRAAEDAIVVDTSALDFDASREALLALIRERLQ